MMTDYEALHAAATAPLNPVEFAELLGRCYYKGAFAVTAASSSEAQKAYIACWAMAFKPLANGDLVPRERVDALVAAAEKLSEHIHSETDCPPSLRSDVSDYADDLADEVDAALAAIREGVEA
jgi:hypothetical protein